MSKLTHGDIAELQAFFNSPLTAGYRSAIQAQGYEPRGPGYDPSTDAKLARLVFEGLHHGRGPWAVTKRLLDHLSEAHVEVLRLVCAAGAGAIAARMPRALAAGRKLAEDQSRARALQDAATPRDGASPMTIAIRVLEADRRFVFRADWMTAAQAYLYAEEAIAAGLVDVDAEVDALVSGVADAWHEAKALSATWKAEAAQRASARAADLRAELAGKRQAKEAARFERRLRGAA